MWQQVYKSSNQRSIYAYIALGALLFVLFHAGGQTVSAVLAGKDFQHAVPVIEKPVADLGKAVAAALTGWMPDTVISTPVGDFSVRTTVAYTIYEWVKLPILLFLTTFGMTLLRLKVGAQKIEKTLGRDDFLGAVSGTITGMLTPVCSCTVTNLYAGLVAGGASRKASTAFLFASPALNEFAIVFMFVFGGLWGGLTYLFVGFWAAITTAYLSPLLGLNPQNFVDVVLKTRCHISHGAHANVIEHAFEDALLLSRRLLLAVLISGLLAGILVNFNLTVVQVMQHTQFQWWGPITATLIGLPLDINAAATAPILMAVSGIVPLGTLVSVMMATTVASIPEVTMLNRLISKRNTARVIAWYGMYTIAIGLLINRLFAGI